MGSKSLDRLKKDALNQLQADADDIKGMFELGESILNNADDLTLSGIHKNLKGSASQTTVEFIKKNVENLKEEYASICETIEKLSK